MKLSVCVVCVLLISCLLSVNCRLPDVTPATHQQQVEVKSNMKDDVSRLPGICRRLKRRRVTVLCNLEKYCWWGRSQRRSRGRSQKIQSGQVCRCPRGSRCSHFFVHSL